MCFPLIELGLNTVVAGIGRRRIRGRLYRLSLMEDLQVRNNKEKKDTKISALEYILHFLFFIYNLDNQLFWYS